MLSSLLRWWHRRRTSAAFMRDYLDAAAPSRRTPALDADYLVLDLEMTGLQPASDRIVSMGWVQVQAGRIRMRTARHVLLAIDGSVAESATVHHLRDQDLSGGCPEREALRILLRALQGRVLVAHHAPLDLRFLHAACRRHAGVPLLARTVDTLALARRRRQRGHRQARDGELRLDALRAAYNLPRYPAHNALSDALATAELFLALLQHQSDETPLRALLQSRLRPALLH
jgi:DNA polymerase-3 subunit epsilon